LNLRQRWAVAVLAAMAIVVSDAHAEIRSGKASFGGLIGVPFFMGDSDLKEGQKPRLLGQANFQYVFNPSWRLSTEFGFGWIGYKDGTPTPYPVYDPDTGDSVNVRDDMLTKFQPLSATLIHALRPQGKGWSPYIGAGVNFTRIEIVNKRLKIKDPTTFDAYVNWSPGVHAVGGFEYVLPSNSNVTFDWSARWSQLLKRDEDNFPSGFTGKHSYLAVSFGVNVYFWPIGYKPVETAKEPVPETAPVAPVAPETTPAPAPTPAPPDTSQVPAPPDTSHAPAPSDTSHAPVPSEPKSAPAIGAALLAPARPAKAAPEAPAATTPNAPATTPGATAPTAAAPQARPLVIEDDADEPACPAADLRPMLGVPSRPRPAEGPLEP
jgi:opacity protein-like surface antigen